jgi:integrase
MTPLLAAAYLEERAEYVRQNTLDLDRQALQTLPGMETLTRVRSHLGQSALATKGRAYTPAQVQMTAAAQTPRHALATQIAHAAGLRAHELLTLRPTIEQPASRHRIWSAARFQGRPDQVRYTVVGKGGLVREVAMPRPLAAQLEARRLTVPRHVTDRQVYYTPSYDLGGGKGWSASFRAASLRALEWSTGAHGVRHSYAQERMEELPALGMDYPEALEVVSQEMGHFRPDITEVYLR